MSLVPDYEDSSAEESEETDDSQSEPEDITVPEMKLAFPSPLQSTPKLPKPGFLTDDKNPLTTSVFANPFIEAEEKKKAVLEKHVKMINIKEKSSMINGRKVCWNYRKGRCRFGHNCKYAHDSDLEKGEDLNKVEHTLVCESKNVPQPSTQELEKIKEESLANTGQKRKRPGLSQGLVPGKKVMKKYHLSQTKAH